MLTDRDVSVSPVQVMGKRSAARSQPGRASPMTAVLHTGAIPSRIGRLTQQPLHGSQREYACSTQRQHTLHKRH